MKQDVSGFRSRWQQTRQKPASAGSANFVAQRLKFSADSLRMISLNLNRLVGTGSARATFVFQQLQQCRVVGFGGQQSTNYGNRSAVFSFFREHTS